MMTKTIVEVRGISKTLDDTMIISDISFSVEEGTIFAILGPNGVGKSTLLKIIVGRLRPDKGAVYVLGEEPYKKRIKELSYLPQGNVSIYHLTVGENLKFYKQLYGVSQERVNYIIKLFELDRHLRKLVRHLSGGFRRRLDLAITFMPDVKLYVLDEPTIELDPIMRKKALELLKEFKKQGKTIIFTSHIEDDLEIADEAFLLPEKKFIKR